MATDPIDRRSAIKAAAAGGIALAVGTIAATVPATSAAAADTTDGAIATAVGTTNSLTRGALNALYPAYRVWNAATQAYPARIPNATNIFFGPVHPGLGMTAADYWANPEATTLAQVEAALLDASSGVLRATETQQKMLIEATRFAPIDNRPATLSSLSPSAGTAESAPAWKFDDGSVSVVGAVVTVPRGWYKVAFRVLAFTPLASPSGGVRWNLRAAAIDVGTAVNATGTVFNVTTPMTVQNRLVGAAHTGTFALDGTKENMVRLSVARLGTDAADTFANPALLLGVRLERQ